jgi:hypothetical protein
VSGEGPTAENARMYERILARTHLSRPSDLPALLAEESRLIGVEAMVIYVIDYEQERLVPIRASGGSLGEPLSVDGTMAGRAYATSTIVQAPVPGEPGRVRVFLPLQDGTERVGALALVAVAEEGTAGEEQVATYERFAHLTAQLLVLKSAYGDDLEATRRRRRMSVAAELLWGLLPPLTFGTDDVVISGLVEPCYDIGGDAFDYAVNGGCAHLAIFDAMGHGLTAAGLTSFALSAYRHSRVHGDSLPETYAAMHEAIVGSFGGERYVTGLVAELDLDTGRLVWVSAGHPPPLLLRNSKLVKTLDAPANLPLGLPLEIGPAEVASESLEPGDQILFYTDGYPEARMPDGELFGVERLAGFVEREAAAGQAAPETLRRLRRALLTEQDSELRDDATALLVQWRAGTESLLLPQTTG